MKDKTQNSEKHSTNETGKWLSYALTECWPGGPIVSHPDECKQIDRTKYSAPLPVPNLTLENI